MFSLCVLYAPTAIPTIAILALRFLLLTLRLSVFLLEVHRKIELCLI